MQRINTTAIIKKIYSKKQIYYYDDATDLSQFYDYLQKIQYCQCNYINCDYSFIKSRNFYYTYKLLINFKLANLGTFEQEVTIDSFTNISIDDTLKISVILDDQNRIIEIVNRN